MNSNYVCQSPVIVTDRYGETHIAPCGECPICRTRKSASVVKRIEDLFTKYRYAYFVTLTYNEESLPRLAFSYIYHRNGEPEDFILSRAVLDENYFTAFDDLGVYLRQPERHADSVSVALASYRNRLPAHACAAAFRYKDFNVGRITPDIGVLNHRDFQLFIKRLRLSISKLNDDHHDDESSEIKYVVCGEYGPIHLRPHYHAVIFTNSRRVNLALGNLIPSCWKLGYVNQEPARGESAHYIGSYISCVADLPIIYKSYVRAFRPYVRFSESTQGSLFSDLEQLDDDGVLNPTYSRTSTGIRSFDPAQTVSKLLSPLQDIFGCSASGAYELFRSVIECFQLGRSVRELNVISRVDKFLKELPRKVTWSPATHRIYRWYRFSLRDLPLRIRLSLRALGFHTYQNRGEIYVNCKTFRSALYRKLLALLSTLKKAGYLSSDCVFKRSVNFHLFNTVYTSVRKLFYRLKQRHLADFYNMISQLQQLHPEISPGALALSFYCGAPPTSFQQSAYERAVARISRGKVKRKHNAHLYGKYIR